MERPLIAIVHTDQPFLELMRELLCDEGYNTLTLTECQGAFAIIRQRQPQLLILELLLTNPEDGWMLVNTIRVHPQTTHLPIIIATTAPQLIRDREVFLRSKGCAILLMPFDVEELLTMAGALAPVPTVHTWPHRTRSDCYSSSSRSS
jgi:CheY-like chemotaxis protein